MGDTSDACKAVGGYTTPVDTLLVLRAFTVRLCGWVWWLCLLHQHSRAHCRQMFVSGAGTKGQSPWIWKPLA